MTYDSEYIDTIITKYLEGEATQEEVEQLSAWIKLSDENSRHFMQMRNIWEVSNPAFDPDELDMEGARSLVMQQIKQEKAQHSLFYYWQRIAAILIIPLLAISIYLYLKPQQEIKIAEQEVIAPYGTRSIVDLPDGSKVWLNAGSSIKFPAIFSDNERKVSLSGEAYFEVESDKKNPFIVKTSSLEVKATGTAFNVEAYEKDSMAAVTLVEGIVNILTVDNRSVKLAPEQKLDYNKQKAVYNIYDTNTYKWCAWKDGVMVFRDDPLEYVFKRLGQVYNVDFIIKDHKTAGYLYRATFEGESLDEILRLLEMSAPIKYKEVSDRRNKDDYYEKQKIEVFQK
ncbi:conserved hypothetical protein [uncultured Dysgonomonas sp.]|uniref:Sigma factor regulatory protein, FecR/PupR family n=2 Tax=uncultured Dysgonomonas sp. TaxID=206096 RepID=A0A212JWL5_9BACT|nr:conserved hypothetical protein [uncultured Dysgonomonas sp.]